MKDKETLRQASNSLVLAPIPWRFLLDDILSSFLKQLIETRKA